VTLALGVALAGVVGAVARYIVDGAVQDRTAGTFPFGTLAVNVAGSIFLGILTGLAWYHGMGHVPLAVMGVGFCGAFTTWSTVAWETVRLADEGVNVQAMAHLFGEVAACLAVAGVALAVVAAA
jgi:CrcB protein